MCGYHNVTSEMLYQIGIQYSLEYSKNYYYRKKKNTSFGFVNLYNPEEIEKIKEILDRNKESLKKFVYN